MFRAIVIDKEEGQHKARMQQVDESCLPDGDVTVKVAYSTLNYKDALAITGRSPVVRSYPMVPGIDLAGEVESSTHPEFKPGDRVLLNGWGVGEKHWGGLAEKARLKGDWLIPVPDDFTLCQTMGVGTAGYTAMLCVMALERQGITPEKGEVLVTGAAGGVGSIAVAVLSQLGYEVVAMTGRPHESQFLSLMGATRIIDRRGYDQPCNPLERGQWAAAIDVAGGQVLANIFANMRYGGVVAACGLAAGMAMPATVAPFILRGITLCGIDSVMVPRERRIEAWQRLARDLNRDKLNYLIETVPFDEVIDVAPAILDGQVRGRLVVPVSG